MRVPRGRSLWSSRLGVPTDASSGAILDELRRVVLDGDAPPGATIPVDDVADLFGVSRTPVREALKALVAEGLVTHQPRSDYAVAQLTRSELQEFYIVRGALELAALASAVEHATESDDQLAIEAHAALGQAVGTGDTRGHHRESRRFHLALLAPASMDRMLHMLESAWNMTEPSQPMAHAGPDASAQFAADHQLMLDAFLARDSATLLATAAAHHEHLAQLIMALPSRLGIFVDD